MRIRPLVLNAMLLSPMAAMADGYHHQRGYTTQRSCYKEIYKEEYVAGTRSSKGYVKSYLDKVEVPCSSLSWTPPVRKYRHRHNHAHYQHNHAHYFPHMFLERILTATTLGWECGIQALVLGRTLEL